MVRLCRDVQALLSLLCVRCLARRTLLMRVVYCFRSLTRRHSS
jgi:hypothetical protein